MIKKIISFITGVDTETSKTRINGIRVSPSMKSRAMVMSKNYLPNSISKKDMIDMTLDCKKIPIELLTSRQELYSNSLENLSYRQVKSQIAEINIALMDLDKELAEYSCLGYNRYSKDKTYQLLRFQHEQLTAKLKLLRIKKRDMLLY